MDLESWACDTLRANNSGTIIVGPPDYSGNIKAISPQEFESIIDCEPGSIDVFTGGPPCQPFSQAATQRFLKKDDRFKRQGFDDFEKGTLLFDYISYIEYFKPKVFLLENVPGLLEIDGGRQLNDALRRLESLGYKHSPSIAVEAAEYGVPQFRKRLIIWGTRLPDITPELPEPTHGGGLFL
jgi:DNA (cytosine-5)-methyltransferase 1